MADITIDPKRVRVQNPSLVVKAKTGEASQLGAAVRFSDEKIVTETDASAAGTVAGQPGMIVSGNKANPAGTVVDGETVDVVIDGLVWIGGAEMTPGDEIFFSDTPGVFSDTAGTVSRRAGFAIGAEWLRISPA